ncbi:hypothetical protein ILUMI_09755 [Ignelater luminosus]|uniref:Uncharacterized protein n=1 Tax=Ignelater luminosus TaxID=2038154 RepID=A0A8K0D3L2_IGNLU|nr:hypothetical protein ILUMI_09755 [Ignelater luminosus]
MAEYDSKRALTLKELEAIVEELDLNAEDFIEIAYVPPDHILAIALTKHVESSKEEDFEEDSDDFVCDKNYVPSSNVSSESSNEKLADNKGKAIANV